MPKLGRRQNDSHQVQYLYPNASVTKNAPFGTGDTPQQRIKIIGSKPVIFREDGFYGTPRWAPSPDPVCSPKRHMTPASRGSHTPQKLAPLAEKPNSFNPSEFKMQAQDFYRSAHQDVHNSHIHSPEPHKVINPHHVVPPIRHPGSEADGPRVSAADAAQAPRIPAWEPPPPMPPQMAGPVGHTGETRAPAGLAAMSEEELKYLPYQPVHFHREQELELCHRVRRELQNTNPVKLKELYMILADFDRHLTGFVPYENLTKVVCHSKFQIPISPTALWCVACQYVDPSCPNSVNYEGVLKFLAASLAVGKAPALTQTAAPQATVESPAKVSSNPKDDMFRNRITQETNDLSPAKVSSNPKDDVFRNPITQEINDLSPTKVSSNPNDGMFLNPITQESNDLSPAKVSSKTKDGAFRNPITQDPNDLSPAKVSSNPRDGVFRKPITQDPNDISPAKVSSNPRDGVFGNQKTQETNDLSPAKVSSNPKDGVFLNPITQEINDLSSKNQPPSPRTKKFPFGTGDNAKLLRMIEGAILDSGEDLDFDKIWATFGRADRGHRGMLSREQIKTLAYASHIPLQDSILDRIIDKLDTSNGQYNWTQFIEFMERVQPMKTGLRIPESKRPTEFVKHYPIPTSDWPQNKEDLVKKPKEGLTSSVTAEPVPSSVQVSPRAAPRVDRMKQLEEHHQQQTVISNVQRQFKKLEDQYETAKKKLQRTPTELEQDLGPWYERFIKLARALYENDLDGNGHLTKREMKFLIDNYNDIHHLGIPRDTIAAVIDNFSSNDRHVSIDAVLKSLRQFSA